MVDFIDDALDFISEIPDHIVELPSTIAEFFGSMFENISELSYMGLGFAIMVLIFVYSLRDYMLNPFLLHMGAVEYYFWGAATYIGCGFFGYLVGKAMFDN